MTFSERLTNRMTKKASRSAMRRAGLMDPGPTGNFRSYMADKKNKGGASGAAVRTTANETR